MDQALGVLRAGRTAWDAGDVRGRWELRATELNGWLSEQGGPSRVSAEQTRQDRQREAELEIELRTVESSTDQCAQQEEVIDQIYSEITAKRWELYERRSEFIEQLNAQEASLTRVEVFHLSLIHISEPTRPY